MKKNLLISALMTIVATVLLGLVYPLVVTALAQLFFRDKANGQLIQRNGTVVASRIIAQPFVGRGIFSPAALRSRQQLRRYQFSRNEFWADQSETYRSRERRHGQRSGGESRQTGPGRSGDHVRFGT